LSIIFSFNKIYSILSVVSELCQKHIDMLLSFHNVRIFNKLIRYINFVDFNSPSTTDFSWLLAIIVSFTQILVANINFQITHYTSHNDKCMYSGYRKH
jgi:hypothetical protein